MKKLIEFPSIEQFRSVVANVNRCYNFVGMDENGNAIYDQTKKKPVIKFKGTCKVHGTNSGVSYNNVAGMWAQSRENIITPEKDNAGFAFFVSTKTDVFQKMFDEIAEKEGVDLNTNTISIYGEFAGSNIQKNVAVSQIPKSMFIFGVKISPFTSVEEDVDNGETTKNAPKAYWVDYTDLRAPEERIFNIDDFGTYEIDVDFNMPQLVQNQIIDMTMAVEKECPVGKFFGVEGIGEGIVFSANVNGEVYQFKSKGELHSASKVKTLASVDVEKLNSVASFVEYAATENRLNQAIENVFPNSAPLEITKMGEIIRWVVNDVIKEETDTMVGNNLEPKDVNKYISARVREMFTARLNLQFFLEP